MKDLQESIENAIKAHSTEDEDALHATAVSYVVGDETT
jgi:hypothetical protein